MKKLICIITSLLVITSALSQSYKGDIKNIVLIEGHVADHVMHKPIPGTLVEQLSEDSTVIQSTKAGGGYSDGRTTIKLARYRLIMERNKRYILRFSREGYETEYLNLDLTDLRSREIDRKMPMIYLWRAMTGKLDEVVVKATKLLFYHKGDTVVYDASAFRLPEGSMLDALVEQLPGAQLNDNGEIFVNGKKVNELLLNGKSFFRGNHRIMLDNLPNYMVSTIQVYDKQNERSEFLGYDTGNKNFVMDVKLKKQYSIGWIGNLEGGGGTEGRYRGRLFATRFTDHSQVSLYANVNNVNENRKPGQGGNWSPDKISEGEIDTRLAGLNYAIDDRNQRFKLSGNAQFAHTDNDLNSHTDRMNFLQTGNTYDRIRTLNREKRLSLSTDHRLYFKRSRVDFMLSPQFYYQKHENSGSYSSATTDREWAIYGKELLDQIFMPDAGDELREILINRNLQNRKGNGSDWKGTLKASSNIKMKYSPDALNLSASVAFKGGEEERFEQNRVDYYRGQSAGQTDFRNHYWNNRPAEGYDYKLKAGYTYKNWLWPTYTLYYQYGQQYETSGSALYRLEQLDGWGMDASHDIGSLPSEELYRNTLDAANSYDSRQWERTHEVGFELNWSKKTSRSKWWAQVRIPITFGESHLQHHQAEKDTAFTRKTTLLNMNSTFFQWKTPDEKHTLTFYYDIRSQAPKMTYFVNVTNDADPLNVMTGNPGLKDSYRYQYKLDYALRNKKKQRTTYLSLSYADMHNSVAMGYVYDHQTGIRTFKPENVNGNWDASAQLDFFSPLDKQQKIKLSSSLSGNYYHSVDLVGTDENPVDRRSIVNTFRLAENLNVKYQSQQFTVNLNVNAGWNNSQSSRKDFTDINALDLHYGLALQWKLPFDWQFNTDLTMYTRRGYAAEEMNTDDLVWNAQLTRPLFKKRILLTVEGFDILKQLNNVTRTLNAQARMETYTNVIPRYLMVRLTYRLNVTPKKKH